MREIEAIEHGQYYHIYNRGINGEDIFKSDNNYTYFMSLYDKYVTPIEDTYAWCLIINHFHILVRIKEETDIGYIPIKNSSYKPPSGIETSDGVLRSNKKYNPSKQFSHLFNSYSQAFNKQKVRHGSLFERPFKRKVIKSDEYFRDLVTYIHNNPVYHGFCEHANEYKWSSY